MNQQMRHTRDRTHSHQHDSHWEDQSGRKQSIRERKGRGRRVGLEEDVRQHPKPRAT